MNGADGNKQSEINPAMRPLVFMVLATGQNLRSTSVAKHRADHKNKNFSDEQIKMFNLLNKHGVDLSVRSRNRRNTVLHKSIKYEKRLDLAERLIELTKDHDNHNVEENGKGSSQKGVRFQKFKLNLKGLLNAVTIDGVTILQNAVLSGSDKMVKLVIEAKEKEVKNMEDKEKAEEFRDFLVRTDSKHMNALHYVQVAIAEMKDVDSIIESLLDSMEKWGAEKIMLPTKNNDGKTPYDLIVEEDGRRSKKIVNNDRLLQRLNPDLGGSSLRRSESRTSVSSMGSY